MLDELREQIANAGRIEAKRLKEDYIALERKKCAHEHKLASFEEQINRKQQVIARLNEKTFKSSIKQTILG